MKSREKVLFVVVSLLLVGVIILAVLLFNSKNSNKKKIDKLQEQVSNMTTNNNELNDKIKKLENNSGKKSGTCTYTKTYLFIDYLDYQGDVPTDKYIIVDIFQSRTPEIIKYNSSEFNIDFANNKYYEFTFKASLLDGQINKESLIDVKLTDRLGLDQVQENCLDNMD